MRVSRKRTKEKLITPILIFPPSTGERNCHVLSFSSNGLNDLKLFERLEAKSI